MPITHPHTTLAQPTGQVQREKAGTQPWTYEEEVAFVTLHQQLGNKWAAIARQLRDRDRDAVNHHVSSLQW